MAEPRTLRSGFLQSRERFPDRVALVVDGEEVTYDALGRLASRIAATMEREADHLDESTKLTAVFAHRSVTAFGGILAALLRGHGYVPLNSTFPADRTRNMLERSGCGCMVVDAVGAKQLPEVLDGLARSLVLIFPEHDDVAEFAEAFPDHKVVGARELCEAESFEAKPADPDDIAYLLFTSGSTGMPKGVMVAHRNVTAFIDAMVERYAIDERDRFSQTFDLTFDLSVFDMFVAWERGARVCCPTQAQKMLPAKYIQEQELTIWFSVPSTGVLMNRLRMLKPDMYPSLRFSLFCGEALPAEILEAFLGAAPNSIGENLYGPTELTIACTLYRWDPARSLDDCELGLVPIGEPYPEMDVLVVDEALNEVAPGETGELLMTGPQLTPGYWQDAEKTAKAFMQPPGKDTLYYRTGDRVRSQQGDRPMVYLGRVDNQIKIQGYRVELGEIEMVMREEAGVDTAIAIGWPETAAGADGVVIFIADPNVDTAAAIGRAKERLPNYMAPRSIELVSDFPLNANGKVDRNALRERLRAAAK